MGRILNIRNTHRTIHFALPQKSLFWAELWIPEETMVGFGEREKKYKEFPAEPYFQKK